MSTSNGHNGHSADMDIDTLYHFWPGLTPAPQPCPEALFSCTMEGCIDGHKTLLTARGQSAAEFKANLQAIRGLLDPMPQPPAKASSQGQGQDLCPLHHVPMQTNQKDGRTWKSHKTADGWCKGR